LEFAKEKLLKLMKKIPDAEAFWQYLMSKWVPKCNIVLKLVFNASENNMRMQHLLVDLMQVVGKQETILVEL
jgi:hypothetical protein